jgi:hypothetical protein
MINLWFIYILVTSREGLHQYLLDHSNQMDNLVSPWGPLSHVTDPRSLAGRLPGVLDP